VSGDEFSLTTGVRNINFLGVERVVLNPLTNNAALPPDICAFGESVCHRLQEKPIHLRLSAQVQRIVIQICVN